MSKKTEGPTKSNLTRANTFKMFAVLNEHWREIEAAEMTLKEIKDLLSARGQLDFPYTDNNVISVIADMGKKVPKVNRNHEQRRERNSRIKRIITEIVPRIEALEKIHSKSVDTDAIQSLKIDFNKDLIGILDRLEMAEKTISKIQADLFIRSGAVGAPKVNTGPRGTPPII